MRSRLIIPRYIVSAIAPYVLLSMLMLSAILFAQQGERFAELLLYADLPFSLLSGVGAALLPGVLIFTIPIATLSGISIGFARMGTDSEIVAMRAAGIGTWTMLWPVLIAGVFLSSIAGYIHVQEVPRAARDLERVAVQAALTKLDSPVDPRTFSTLPRYVIYVRDGDKSRGIWQRVFIFTQQSDKAKEVFTARSGRIDSSGNQAELVLSDVLATRFPATKRDDGPVTPVSADDQSYVVERSDQLRIAINTGRADLLKQITQHDDNADEMEWGELRARAAAGTPAESREAQRIINQKLSLSLSPLVFAFLGGALGLRIRRGGKSVGALLSLVIVIVYYLISLLGTSMVRAGTISPVLGSWMPTALMLLLSFLFLVSNRISISARSVKRPSKQAPEVQSQPRSIKTHGINATGFPTLMDVTLFRTLTATFVIGFVGLASIFNIFTLFELWRFIAMNHTNAGLVARYLLFLLPLVAVELFPATMLISVLITYALLSRRRETIAWWASGQSVYRLMLPGIFFATVMGACSWLIQEHVMPESNLRQDALRARIKGGEARATTGTGRQWLAATTTKRLYSYEFDDGRGMLREPTIYELDSDGVHISKITEAKSALWVDSSTLKLSDVQTLVLNGLEVKRETAAEARIGLVESPAVFKPSIDKPSQLSATGLRSYLQAAKQRGIDVSALAVALQRKYAGPFAVMIMAFIGMPLAVIFGRKGAMIALCVAVVLSVAYWAVGGGFQQLGNHGLLRPAVAGWSPLLIFAAAGTYFLSRVRT
ncbi:MAG: LptF/LptG family permease [Pyrinomonadaceae bacterium]